MKPLLLLIPGMFNTTAIWDSVRQALSDHDDAPVVLVADVSSQDSIGAMAQDAWQLVAPAAAGRPLVVAGFSMGGYVALELLANHPGRVQALAMIDSAAGVETAESTNVRMKTISALERNFERTVEGIINFSLHPHSLQDSNLPAAMRSMMHEVGAATAIRQNHAIIARRDHRALLAAWRLPTLIVCGREDKVTPPALSQDILSLVPHARLSWIDDAGHQTVLEQPQVVASELMNLVRQAIATV